MIDQMKKKFKPGKKWVDRLMDWHIDRIDQYFSTQQAFFNRCLLYDIVCFTKMDIDIIEFFILTLSGYPRLNFGISVTKKRDLYTVIEKLQFSKRIFVISSRRNMEFG